MHPQYTPSIDYFAGYFDGEGCVLMRARMNGRDYRLEATIKSGCLPILELFHEQFGGSLVKLSRWTNKPLYEWRLGNLRECSLFFHSIHPFTIEKRPQIAAAIEWLEYRLALPVRGPRAAIDPSVGHRIDALIRELKRN